MADGLNMEEVILQALVKEKTLWMLRLAQLTPGSADYVEAARRAGNLEHDLATVFAAIDRTDDAVFSMISEAACRRDAGQHSRAERILRQASVLAERRCSAELGAMVRAEIQDNVHDRPMPGSARTSLVPISFGFLLLLTAIEYLLFSQRMGVATFFGSVMAIVVALVAYLPTGLRNSARFAGVTAVANELTRAELRPGPLSLVSPAFLRTLWSIKVGLKYWI